MRAYVAMAALMALGLACATKGVPAEDQTEPVFWEVCYDLEGTVTSYDGVCEKPEQITWKLPIRVYISQEYPDRLTVLQGMDVWNRWMGAELFKEVTGEPEFDGVDVFVFYQEDAGYAGIAQHFKVDGRVFFGVALADEYAHSTEVVVHELGHVLGLAHDPGRPRSVMYPSTQGHMPWLTQKDCRALGYKYKLNPPACD